MQNSTKSQLVESRLLVYLTADFKSTSVKQFKSFDCNTKQVQVYDVPQLTGVYNELNNS